MKQKDPFCFSSPENTGVFKGLVFGITRELKGNFSLNSYDGFTVAAWSCEFSCDFYPKKKTLPTNSHLSDSVTGV